MGFASTWIQEKAIFPELIKDPPDQNTGIIIVVPAYNETGITFLLDSLSSCRQPDCNVEVIVVINAPENAPGEHLETNRRTFNQILGWKEKSTSFFRLYPLMTEPVVRGWGVGLARKTGMDEALRRFDSINNPDGVILSLDADCRVDQGYLLAVSRELVKRKDRSACSIYFEHPLSGDEFPGSVYRSIILYELHLRFFFQALIFSGFPDVFHTVGSATAVKALPYMKAGGMNRRQAGEDFYFIQKLIPPGGYFSLNDTTVYPSPRKSIRVPFGTGATITRLAGDSEPELYTYNILAFRELGCLIGNIEKIYEADPGKLISLYNEMPAGLKSFIDENEWCEKLTEIKNNTSGLQSFKKRFFGWFNMFRTVKFLNHVHRQLYDKKPVFSSAAELLEIKGMGINTGDPARLLECYRLLEKKV